jgi:predicted alpha/beta-fold hydrolase
VGLANKAFFAGMNVIRMNVRNCGGTEKLAATLYHSGMSDDIDRVIRFFLERDGLPMIFLAGFSMGGNQVLKLLGEWSSSAPKQVIAAAAISPAMDLGPSADAIHSLQNRLYEWRFLTSLRGRMKRKVALFPENFKVERWWWKSIRDFDDALTAPHFGFSSAEDYYTQASSSRVVDHVRVPTLIIHAADDPFIRIRTETYGKLRANPAIKFVEVEHGGHCGFLGERRMGAEVYDGRWSERQIVRFCVTAQSSD